MRFLSISSSNDGDDVKEVARGEDRISRRNLKQVTSSKANASNAMCRVELIRARADSADLH